MIVISSVTALREYLRQRQTIGFVPTMGNLHEGHIDLTRIARQRVGEGGTVVLSVFVNRLQFTPHEDFDKYPRTLADDCAQCEAAGVDVVFAPTEQEMYPVPQSYVVEPPNIQHILDGAVRPGHFRGVATVVLKLFNMVQPQIAVFGKKDYQQCCVLTNMVRELNLPIDMILAETVRASDGLALSSRNGYLTAYERTEAPRLYALLSTIRDRLISAPCDIAALERDATDALSAHGWQPDYVAIRRQQDLDVPAGRDTKLVILAAAKLGNTRLIDNLEVQIAP